MIRRPWHPDIKPTAQLLLERAAERLQATIASGRGPDANELHQIVERCRLALQLDAQLLDFVGYAHGVSNGETIAEYSRNGATEKARTPSDA